MTYEQLENNYKSKKEKLDAMLERKTKEEILALYEDESFCEPGQGKTDRFFEAFMEAFGAEQILPEETEDNNPEEAFQQAEDSPEEKAPETDSPETSLQLPDKKTEENYTAAWTIRCSDKVWTAGQKVAAEEFGADFKRLLEIGALVQK